MKPIVNRAFCFICVVAYVHMIITHCDAHRMAYSSKERNLTLRPTEQWPSVVDVSMRAYKVTRSPNSMASNNAWATASAFRRMFE